VFEFADHDLQGVIDANIQFSLPEIKCLMKQLLEGMNYIHKQSILHRDIKSGNLLLTKDGVLKIADFGLGRVFFPSREYNYTNGVVTLWYRAPELLLGVSNYDSKIDLWSIG
jgi:serine/threonine protein kinase